MIFQKHHTICRYKLNNNHYAFTLINFEKDLIYLDTGGKYPLPVRLSDVENIEAIGQGKLVHDDGTYKWM